ncbi:MAG: tyrosine-type recombinase/integrase [Firmicutes bacterium]|nr:tyrosine-type recombinase/integrase [Bacillota bacterium]
MDYFKERDIKNLKQLEKELKHLPPFCSRFFLGIGQTTTPLTRVGYALDLKNFFEFLKLEIDIFYQKENFELADLELVEAFHIELYLNYLNKSCGQKMKQRRLCTLRSMFKYFFRQNLISKNILPNIDLPKINQKEIIRLEPNEVRGMVDVTEQADPQLNQRQKSWFEHTKVRDNAIVTLLLGTGIRVSECVGLNLNDIDFSANSLRVTRKGGNTTILYFGDEVAEKLKSHIGQREIKAEALFLSLQNKRIDVRTVQIIVKKYAHLVTPLKKITPHKLRSTYGTALYKETGDIYIVADVLGHKDVNTTKKHYAAISEDARKNVANLVKLKKD